jgi:NAD(P)-dependent dehydrogenase (short-subunit alcohol dehydrogenase family)
MFNLQGKRAYITGGTSGIGRAVAELFVENGVDVVIVDIMDGVETARAIGAQFLHCDVSDEDNVASSLAGAVDVLGGKLDIVVLNAGIGDVGPTFEETDQALLERMTKVNQWSVLYGLKHAPGKMNDGGAIISTSSMAAYINMPGTGVYSAGKQAMVSMTQMAALELGHRAIRVNTVCPAYVNTSMGNSPEEKRIARIMSALGRPAEPKEDLAGVYLFLASDASRYMTGQALQVDGGWALGPTPALLELVTGSAATPGS